MSLFKGTHTVTRADKISNFQVNTAEYGAPVMEVLGTTRISGNVIYYDDFTAHEHRETQRTGKGGKSSSTNITYTYTVAAILGLCEGPISSIGKIWVNKEVYDYPSDDVPLTLFTGTANQQPWAYVTGHHPDRALAYENLAYMAGIIDLGDSAGLPSYNFEVKGKLLSTGDGIDVNPMDYIKYVLSKVGQSNATVYGESNFREYCAEADLLISTPADATGTEEAQKIVNEIANLCGAYIFWSNDAYKIVPLADRPVGDWEPDKTIRYDLTKDDFIPQNGSCVTWARKDSSEQYNRFTVEFSNRANSYEKESVTYEDTEDIAERGVKQAPTIQAGYVYTRERAVLIAEAAARRNKVGKNQYQFKLGWAFCRLEPGDLVRITDEASGIVDQAVMITTIQEDARGLLSITAISWFDDDYGEAEYDVHEVDRPDIDFNCPPGNTATPVIFQPPADITLEGLEVWIAAKGVTDDWGGCTVYISDDNTNYRTLGQISNTARFGPLASDITADATTLEVTINGALISGTQQDAQRANTLLWIDGECMSYQTATLLQNGNYQLSGLIRGQYNTTASAHSTGSMLVRCDEALLKAPFLVEDIGKTIYLKFCSYNIFGAAEQSLADVTAYQYTLLAYYIPPVTGISAYNRYRMIKDGVSRYDIVVSWTPPSLQSYLEGQVWYKTSNGQANNIAMASGVAVSQMGFTNGWTFGGVGKNTVTIPQATVGDTYRIAVTTKDKWGAVTSADLAPYITITVALKTETPNTPDDFAIVFTDKCTVSWSEVTNSDIMFYEVRADTYYGVESPAMLARTGGTKATVALTQRSGTLYLYAKSPSGKYSTPAVLRYSKEVPPKPDKPVVSANLGSINIVAGAIPNGCLGMNVYINGDGIVSAFTQNNTYTHSCEAGIYDVSVAYVDVFGEGQHSTEARIVIKKTIDASLLEDEAVNIAKVDATIQAALEDATNSARELITVNADMAQIEQDLAMVQAQGEGVSVAVSQTDDKIEQVITNLNRGPGNTTYASISQLQQTVSGLQSMIETISVDGEGNTDQIEVLRSQINQTASDLTATVTKLNQSPSADGQFSAITQLKTTADGISTTVTNNKTTETDHYNANVSAINQQADRITTIISNLNDSEDAAENYSAIAQMQDNIELRVAKSGVISAINLTPETARIRGKLITLDGDTSVSGYFWANAVSAKSIDVSKINANSLSALSANIGSVSGGTITGTTIVGSTIRNANNTFSVSANGAISGATLTTATINSGTINANMITSAGFEVKASNVRSGTISGNNGTIPLPSGYTEAQCLWVAYPPSYPSTHPNNASYLYGGSHFSINGRVVTAYADYDLSGDEQGGNTMRYYPSVQYRCIGIK